MTNFLLEEAIVPWTVTLKIESKYCFFISNFRPYVDKIPSYNSKEDVTKVGAPVKQNSPAQLPKASQRSMSPTPPKTPLYPATKSANVRSNSADPRAPPPTKN